MKPALAALVTSPRLTQFRFGDASYLERVLRLAPTATLEPQPRTPDATPATTVLGDSGSLSAVSSVVQVTLVLRDASMPVDGATQLAFFLDAATLETLFVHRILGG